MNFLSILNHHYLLQVGVKSAVCGALRKAPIMTKGCFLATSFTDSHFDYPFNYSICPAA
jgi:hypothetical protein